MGFAKLNEYSSKISEGVTPFCSCGKIETVEHFVLKCSRYEEARERLINEFYFITGSLNVDMEALFTVGKDETNLTTDTQRQRLLAEYIEETGRFN